ncbi:MAG TPA: sensor histidine kinase [Streptosporangiaceae bacterium]
MRIRRPSAQLELWERWEQPAMAALPYVMLVIVASMTVVIKWGESTGDLLIDLGLAAAAGAWILWNFTLHPAWRQRPRRMVVFFIVLAILMALLVLRAPWYGFFTFTGYLYAFYLPTGRARAAGVALIALITATSQNGGLPKHWTAGAVVIYLVIICINVGVAGALTWFGWVSAQQNDQRKQMVAELSEANRRLKSILEENQGLHDQLLAQAREAGMLDERQRMAREIHDTLAQGLTGIITQLQAAERHGQSQDERRRHIDLATQLARDSLTEARRSVQAMQPEPLESARLPEALADVASKWTRIHGVPATVTTTGQPRRIRPDAEITLLRAAQEALVNVARHARAGKVGLTLSYMEDQVNLDIRDDGVGFDPQPAGATVPARAGGSGYGLLAMRQRVEGVAGTLEVESAPGGGTAISASVPTDGGW